MKKEFYYSQPFYNRMPRSIRHGLSLKALSLKSSGGSYFWGLR
jgi:hypothetical protein